MDCYAHLAAIEPDSGARPNVNHRPVSSSAGSVAAIPQPCGRVSVVTVTGTLRAPLTFDVSRAVEARIRLRERHVLLDLAEVTDMDAAGVGELIRAFNAVRVTGGALRIAHATRYVRRLLQVAGLFTLLMGGART
jgi:anti-anti-sigma factor